MTNLICSACHQRIKGNYIQAVGKNWHPDCFRCAVCGELIQSSGFLVKAGKPYHPECYHPKYTPRCSACGQVISGNYIRAFRKYWHPEHFVCAHCHEPIGGNFFAHQGKPYCERDYRLLFAEKCARCGAVLTGRYMEDLWGNKYCSAHKKEPRCSSCTRFIGSGEVPTGVKYADGRIMCSSCLKTAVNSQPEMNRLLEDIQKVLARYDLHFDKKIKLPISLTGQRELHSSLQKRSRGQNTAGVTQTYIHTLFGVESSREVKLIQVLYGLPYEHMGAVLTHELGHAWLFLNHYPLLPRHIEEGICEWMASLWLETRNSEMAKFRLLMLEKNPNQVYGRGYRAVRKAVQRSSSADVLNYVKRHASIPSNMIQ